MKTKFVEATQGIVGGLNHGKFMVGRFDEVEWARACALDEQLIADGWRDTGDPMNPWPLAKPLLTRVGWSAKHVMVFDLQTGEGALFAPGGSVAADLAKHKVWVCPMFEPFLGWLYEVIAKDPEGWFEGLPSLVEIPDAPGEMFGHRRPGPALCGAQVGESDSLACELDEGHEGLHRNRTATWNYDARVDRDEVPV